MNQPQILLMILVFIAIAGLVLFLMFSGIAGDRRLKFLEKVAGRRAAASNLGRVNENTITDMSLQARVKSANLNMSPKQFLSAVWSVPILLFGIVLYSGAGLPIAALVGFASSVAAPRVAYMLLNRRRIALFSSSLPWALDVVVRGTRAGLPVSECIRVVAAEGSEPIASEFRAVLQDQAVGRTIPEAFENMANRIRSPDVKLLRVVMSIQQQTGGNIADVLQSFNDSMRARQSLIDRISAITSESKVSAFLLSVLPFAAYFIVSKSFPERTQLLFTTTLGNILVAGIVIWNAIGIYIIVRLVNIKV